MALSHILNGDSGLSARTTLNFALDSINLLNLLFDVVAPAATGNQATDTANLNTAITATPANGSLFIPRGRYEINAALTVSKALRICGGSSFELLGGGISDVPFTSPYLAGTVINQNAAATDILKITSSLTPFNLENIGFRFADSIMFSNTGHGINCDAGAGVFGIAKGRWQNVNVFGNDGNHYAYRFNNSVLLTLDTLRSCGGGGFAFLVDDPTVNYGNMQIIHPYHALITAGSADAYHLQGANSGTFGALNLMNFERPQAMVEDWTAHFPTSTKPTASQFLWFTDQTLAASGASYVRGIQITNPDFEAAVPGVASGIQFNKDMSVLASGTMSGSPAYITIPDYNPLALPTATVQPGAGTGATAAINGGPPAPSTLTGLIILQTGTSPGTGAFNDLVQVNFTSPLFRDPKGVMLFPTFCSDSTPFMIHNSSKNGFMVMTALGSVIGASKTYQILYQVLP